MKIVTLKMFYRTVLDKLYILDNPNNLGNPMVTILIKNLPEDLLKELKKLKVELGCRTWAELLAKLVESGRAISLTEEKLDEMRAGVQGFLELKSVVSNRWVGPPSALEELRRSRRHGTA